MSNLTDELISEVKRVTAKKERWLKMMWEHDMGPGMQLTINIMQAEIEAAIFYLAHGNVKDRMRSFQTLKDYDDD